MQWSKDKCQNVFVVPVDKCRITRNLVNNYIIVTIIFNMNKSLFHFLILFLSVVIISTPLDMQIQDILENNRLSVSLAL